MANPMAEIFAARNRLTLAEARDIVAPYVAERQRLIKSHGVDNGRKNFRGDVRLDHGAYAVCCGPVNEALDALEKQFESNVVNIAAMGMIEADRDAQHVAEGADAVALSVRIAYGDGQ